MSAWQAGRHEENLSFVKGKEMTQLVCDQLLEAESATSQGQHHAATMWDMNDFYETMNRDTLQQKHTPAQAFQDSSAHSPGICTGAKS